MENKDQEYIVNDNQEQMNQSNYNAQQLFTLQNTTNAVPKKKRTTAIIVIASIVTLAIVASVGLSIFLSPLNRAERMLSKELGTTVRITEAWYSKEEDSCLLSYSSNGIPKTAGIMFDEDKVILQDVVDKIHSYSNNPYSSDEEKHKSGQAFFNYGGGDLYFWQYQIVRGDGDWRKIK